MDVQVLRHGVFTSCSKGTVYSQFLHSLFAAQAGASKVIAIDGSSKMAAVASQVLFSRGCQYEPGFPFSGLQNLISKANNGTGIFFVSQNRLYCIWTLDPCDCVEW